MICGFPLASLRTVPPVRRLKLPGCPPVPTAATTASLGLVTADRTAIGTGPSPAWVVLDDFDPTMMNTAMRTTTMTAAPPPIAVDDFHQGWAGGFWAARLARMRCFLLTRLVRGFRSMWPWC